MRTFSVISRPFVCCTFGFGALLFILLNRRTSLFSFQASSEVTDVRSSHSSDMQRDNILIVYNRIPKTGSTSFMSVMYSLCEENKFHALYVNVSTKSHIFTFIDEHWFVKNISTWNERKPAIYHGHFPFTNFIRHGYRQPVYINIVRPPLERLVSFYYFVRYGDTFRPHLKRSKMGDTRTFDECVKQKGPDCQPSKLWVQIPYFCGSFPQCWDVGNPWALAMAKQNLVTYYHLVGTTDRIDAFMQMLEISFPRIFKGATKLFMEGGGKYVRKTKIKKPIQPDTVEIFHKDPVWQMENEFYLFAEKIFNMKLKSLKFARTRYQKVKPS